MIGEGCEARGRSQVLCVLFVLQRVGKACTGSACLCSNREQATSGDDDDVISDGLLAQTFDWFVTN